MQACDAIRCFAGAITIVSGTLWGTPVIIGLQGNHPLQEKQTGEVLITELRCRACHKDDTRETPAMREAPDLSEINQRLNPEYVQSFIANPTKFQPGSMMPDMLTGQTPQKRFEISKAITHFLMDRDKLSGALKDTEHGEFAVGRKLFHEIGCVACHPARNKLDEESTVRGLPSLKYIDRKYSSRSLAEFLFNPFRARPAGRMPDMKLSKKEALHLATYLRGKNAPAPESWQANRNLAEKGRKYFREFNCAACHSLEREKLGKMALPFAELKPGGGCLSQEPKSEPDYLLSKRQRTAINKVLKEPVRKISTEEKIGMTLTTFNCIACHSRDDYGGPSKEFLTFLQTSEEGLGNEARIPPPLTLAGAKLKPQWIRKVMFDGESVRPYMHTRMPIFREDSLRHFPNMLIEVDRLESISFAEPKRQERGKIRSFGHQLVGDKGLNCVACHNFNGKDSSGFKGIDLLNSYERLRWNWFYRFLLNPTAYRSGIVMPNYWTGGKGFRQDILAGKTDAQIQAIWHYFSYGQGAPTPSGIHSPGSSLEVDSEVRTYRGRSRIAGYRGIAVGFPSGLSYGFNAETGTLSGLWKGEFISVGWGGQGAGNFNPKSRAVSLPQDLSFHALPASDAPWPLLPVMNKENPVNPDPLYPKNLGYQFLGYSLDEDFVPTFSYRIGDLTIEDKSTSVIKEGETILNRILNISTNEPRTIHFRALVGKIEKVSETSYKTPDLSLNLNANKATPNILRPLHSDENSLELLLNLYLPKGKSAFKLHYDLLH